MLLSEEQTMVRQAARDYARKRLRPNAAEWERRAGFAPEVVRELGELGLMGVTVPEEWGGAGADYVAYALALEEIAAGDGAVATVMSGHNSVGCMPLVEYGSLRQKDVFLRPMARGEKLCAFCLTEPQGGSDLSTLRTRAERRGGHYVLNGTKQFITSGKTADLAVVIAVTDPTAGTSGFSAFLVDTSAPGYRVGRVERKMGLNASDTCEIFLEDLQVPVENRLGDEGQGHRIALSNLEGGRIGIASTAVGMARSALELAIAYASERITFGRPIIRHQGVSFRLADMATRLEAARQLVLHAAALRSQGLPCITEASMAKLFATEMAEQVCSDALQTFGGQGYIEDAEVERIYRCVRGSKIYEGTNDIQRIVIGRSLAQHP
jgi:alkylation response protein AidB-like acyl-CoA dehydrogenase